MAAISGVSTGILPKFKFIQAFIVGLVTCKNEEDSSKIEGTRVATTFSHYKSMGIFPDAQWQLTQQSKVRSGRISSPFEMLWVPLLPAIMKKIHLKMKALEWSQHFSNYKYWDFSRRSRATNP